MTHQVLSSISSLELNFHELGLATGYTKRQSFTIFETHRIALSALDVLSLDYPCKLELDLALSLTSQAKRKLQNNIELQTTLSTGLLR